MKAFQRVAGHQSSTHQPVQPQSVMTVVDNRSIAQRKFQEAINNSTQVDKGTLMQRMAQRATGGTQPVIQRNKHWKRFLNVVSLGGRKAYVNHKRSKRAGQHVQVIQAPVIDEEEEFAKAYEKSRYYHRTHPDNLNSIDQNGLLNYEDRVGILGNDVGGMSQLGGEYAGDEKKGVFLGPKHFMQENSMTTNVIRAYLPSSRTKLHHWNETDVPSQEIMRDEKFRGGAVITKDSIFAPNITAKNIGDLLDEDDPKLRTILAAVGSHYEGQAPDEETMKQLLGSALRNRRLSNAAFDNV